MHHDLNPTQYTFSVSIGQLGNSRINFTLLRPGIVMLLDPELKNKRQLMVRTYRRELTII